VQQRRRRLDAERRAQLAALLHALPVTIDSETADRAWTATAELAERFGLSVYDAAYLEVALRRALPLASLDRALRAAAMTTGVEVFGMA
jgi:predicted nucleic acid-binding protein